MLYPRGSFGNDGNFLLTFTIYTYCFYILRDSLRDRQSGDLIPARARFYPPFPSGPVTHSASCTTGTRSFPGLKRRKRGLEHPLLCLHVLWNMPLLLHIKLLYFLRVWFFFFPFLLFFSSAESCTLNSVYPAFTKKWVVYCTSIFVLVCDIEVCFLNWFRGAMP